MKRRPSQLLKGLEAVLSERESPCTVGELGMSPKSFFVCRVCGSLVSLIGCLKLCGELPLFFLLWKNK